MKKLFLIGLLALIGMSAKATVLFPFFVDIAPDYNEGISPEFQEMGVLQTTFYATAISFYPKTFSQLESFFKDVLPSDVTREEKVVGDKTLVTYSSLNSHSDDTIVTSGLLCTIYIIKMPDGSFKAAYLEAEVE